MRYLPLTAQDRREMLTRIGVSNIDALFTDVPAQYLLKHESSPKAALQLPERATEMDVERQLTQLASRNRSAGAGPFFVGCGAYRHHVPALVDHMIQRSEFLTSYTPYQAEIAQGTLQTLFEFQTQIALLTGMDVANASMYDGSTATAEAVLMAHRIKKRSKALLSGGLHAHYAEVIETACARFENVRLAPDISGSEDLVSLIDETYSCVVIQTPDMFGHLHDMRALAQQCQAKGVLLIVVVTEIISLGALQTPGAMGADIVVGEGQSIGNGLIFGGPYVGFFATREAYVRQMPGRLAGQTVDADGKRSFVLTLSTREQHIRREKATSNICTNAGLCALAFTIHMSLLGGRGLQQLARVNHAHAVNLANRLAKLPGIEVLNKTFFNEFTLRLKGQNAAQVVEILAHKHNILAGVPVSRLLPKAGLDDLLILATTELTTQEDIEALVTALGEFK